MSVRHGLLAILDQGPCYGYQLRAEYERRTGTSVNVGQVYTTLERLERDGLVEGRGVDDQGHVYWGITEPGRAATSLWLAAPARPSGRDDLAHKIALAATLPGVDAGAVIATQRTAATERLGELDKRTAGQDAVSDVIVLAAASAQARAEIQWLDAAAAAVAASQAARTFPLSSERPRRGRPRAVIAPAEASGAGGSVAAP